MDPTMRQRIEFRRALLNLMESGCDLVGWTDREREAVSRLRRELADLEAHASAAEGGAA